MWVYMERVKVALYQWLAKQTVFHCDSKFEFRINHFGVRFAIPDNGVNKWYRNWYRNRIKIYI